MQWTKLRGTKRKEEGHGMDLITKASFTRGLRSHGPWNLETIQLIPIAVKPENPKGILRGPGARFVQFSVKSNYASLRDLDNKQGENQKVALISNKNNFVACVKIWRCDWHACDRDVKEIQMTSR